MSLFFEKRKPYKSDIAFILLMFLNVIVMSLDYFGNMSFPWLYMVMMVLTIALLIFALVERKKRRE